LFVLIQNEFKNLKPDAMKRSIIAFSLMISAIACFGQKSVDKLFSSYSDRDNFFTMHLGGPLLKFVISCDNDRDDDDDFLNEIREIRILGQKDDQDKMPDFYNRVMRDIDTDEYEEFMRVKSSDENMIMLVKGDGSNFKEFLMVAGGENNVVIQIKGTISYKDARKLSDSAKKDHGKNMFHD
jgi:hypothetical protein